MSEVPDHRFQELVNQVKALTDQNTMLRGQVDKMVAGVTGAQPQPKSKFEAPVQAALREEIENALSQERQKFGQAVGFLTDQNDQLKFMVKYGTKAYEKYQPEVEKIVQNYQAQQKWISREDALKLVHWEKTGSKLQEPVVEPKDKGPEYDPYTGMVTAKPDAPPTEVNPETLLTPQAPPTPVWNAETKAWTLPGQPQVTAAPALPKPVLNEPVAAPPNGKLNLSIESDDRVLSEFANRYGNVPL